MLSAVLRDISKLGIAIAIMEERTKRVGLTKKLRFEVFKRMAFAVNIAGLLRRMFYWSLITFIR